MTVYLEAMLTVLFLALLLMAIIMLGLKVAIEWWLNMWSKR